MSYRGSIYDHQFHIRPEATTTFGETIAMYLAQELLELAELGDPRDGWPHETFWRAARARPR